MFAKLIRSILSFFSHSTRTNAIRIEFYKAANVFGEHGFINVSHRKHKLVDQDVRFVFVGVSTPPVLSLSTMALIWDAAEAEGYIPHYISSYGTENDVLSAKDRLLQVVANDGSRPIENNSCKPEWLGPGIVMFGEGILDIKNRTMRLANGASTGATPSQLLIATTLDDLHKDLSVPSAAQAQQ